MEVSYTSTVTHLVDSAGCNVISVRSFVLLDVLEPSPPFAELVSVEFYPTFDAAKWVEVVSAGCGRSSCLAVVGGDGGNARERG